MYVPVHVILHMTCHVQTLVVKNQFPNPYTCTSIYTYMYTHTCIYNVHVHVYGSYYISYSLVSLLSFTHIYSLQLQMTYAYRVTSSPGVFAVSLATVTYCVTFTCTLTKRAVGGSF